MLIIWEMANNHNGSLETAFRIVDRLKNVCKDYTQFDFAIKLQLRNIETFIHPNYKDRFDLPYIKRFTETQLSKYDFDKLGNYIKDSGFKVGVTPFDEESVEYLEPVNVDFVKVASCCANEWGLLEKITGLNKKIIVSTAGLDWDEIDNVYSFLKHKDAEFSILHCIGEYPAKDFNMNVIDKMKRRYNVPIGYSGHEHHEEVYPSIMAMAKGIDILERHICLENGNDYSINIVGAKILLENLSHVELVNGSDKKEDLFKEKENLRSLKRGVWKKEDGAMFFAIPNFNTQLLSDEFGEYKKNYDINSSEDPGIVYKKECVKDKVYTIRKYIHRAKGILSECGVSIGNTYQAELSHHYGFNKFEEYGGIIISLINRDYCKKLIIMFPNQKYPVHTHHHKEETFRVLHGDLIVIMGGQSYGLNSGDSLLVDRYRPHSFYTLNGVIFEEISTTHVLGDSYYEDTEIYKIDPMERKTIVEKL